MSRSKSSLRARAYPPSDAQICRPKTARSGLGLPCQGRARIKKLVQSRKESVQSKKVCKIRVGTLNVGTMTGKSREIVDLMQRRKVEILCVQETRWRGNKAKVLAEGFKMFYSGADEKGRNGVAIVVDKELKKGVCEVKRIDDRIMSLKLEIGGNLTTVVCAYAPQVGCEEVRKEEFWRNLDQLMVELDDGERVIVGGDLNGHVGRRQGGEERVHGGWGLGERNEEGKNIVGYAMAYDLGMINTFFEKKEEHLITYKSGKRTSQIDYIMCRRKHVMEIKNCKVINGESVATQHRLLVVDCEIKVGKREKHWNQRERRIRWWKLREENLRERFKEEVMREIEFPENVQEWWEVNSDIIRKIGEKVLGKTSGKDAPDDKESWWWSREVQEVIKQKKVAKSGWDVVGSQEAKEVYILAKKEAKRTVARAKARAVEEAYKQMEGKDGDRQLLRIAKARDKASKDITSVKQIKDEVGAVIWDQRKIRERWKEYFDKLLNEENRRVKFESGEMREVGTQDISRKEVEVALGRMKKGKAVGVDQIPVEVWISLEEDGIDVLWDLIQKLWQQEQIPDEWRRSILVPIYKGKGDVQECGNYRGIKLMSHTMKIWERVVEGRVRQETMVCEEQFGFMPGRGTTDAIFALRQLMERYRENDVELHMVFIDLEKAYDRIPRQEIWRCMREKGTPEKYVRLVKVMYKGAETLVRSSVGKTDGFTVKVGLHQGSTLSPYLFDLIMDVMVRDVKSRAPWSMMFADDIVLCEETREELERKLEEWRMVLEDRGMKINRMKTEYVTSRVTGDASIKIQDVVLPARERFRYLGSIIEKDGGLEAEIQHRIQCGWMNWRKISGVLCDKKVSCKMKGKMYKLVVRPAMLYGGETWPLTRAQERKLEVAEMRMLRWMSGVTRKDRIRNEYIRGTVKVGPMSRKIQESRLRWFGHVERRDEEYVGKRVRKIEVAGKRKRGRPKMRWMDRVTEDLKEKGWSGVEALDRKGWKRKIREGNADPI